MKAEIIPGSLVISKAGRDKGLWLAVLNVSKDGYALVADGKLRKAINPKRKKLMHLQATSICSKEIAKLVNENETVTDELIKRELNKIEKNTERNEGKVN